MYLHNVYYVSQTTLLCINILTRTCDTVLNQYFGWIAVQIQSALIAVLTRSSAVSCYGSHIPPYTRALLYHVASHNNSLTVKGHYSDHLLNLVN